MSISINFYTVDKNDWLSEGLYLVGAPFFPCLKHVSHCALETKDYVYEMTLHGVYATPAILHNRKPVECVCIEIAGMDELLITSRVLALLTAGTRLRISSLVSMAMRKKADDLLCTGFVECILGIPVQNGTPYELWKRLTNNGTILKTRILSEMW